VKIYVGITGLSATGKNTIADMLADLGRAHGRRVYLYNLSDEVREELARRGRLKELVGKGKLVGQRLVSTTPNLPKGGVFGEENQVWTQGAVRVQPFQVSHERLCDSAGIPAHCRLARVQVGQVQPSDGPTHVTAPRRERFDLGHSNRF
jgi:hypothetical protein